MSDNKSGNMSDNESPRGALTVRISAMPADTNANGDIFGGWVLSRMDQAGGIAGVERARGRVVTVAPLEPVLGPAGGRTRVRGRTEYGAIQFRQVRF
jgi:hypothetical protein